MRALRNECMLALGRAPEKFATSEAPWLIQKPDSEKINREKKIVRSGQIGITQQEAKTILGEETSGR